MHPCKTHTSPSALSLADPTTQSCFWVVGSSDSLPEYSGYVIGLVVPGLLRLTALRSSSRTPSLDVKAWQCSRYAVAVPEILMISIKLFQVAGGPNVSRGAHAVLVPQASGINQISSLPAFSQDPTACAEHYLSLIQTASAMCSQFLHLLSCLFIEGCL